MYWHDLKGATITWAELGCIFRKPPIVVLIGATFGKGYKDKAIDICPSSPCKVFAKYKQGRSSIVCQMIRLENKSYVESKT